MDIILGIGLLMLLLLGLAAVIGYFRMGSFVELIGYNGSQKLFETAIRNNHFAHAKCVKCVKKSYPIRNEPTSPSDYETFYKRTYEFTYNGRLYKTYAETTTDLNDSMDVWWITHPSRAGVIFKDNISIPRKEVRYAFFSRWKSSFLILLVISFILFIIIFIYMIIKYYLL